MPTNINIAKSLLESFILYLPTIKKNNKKIDAIINLYDATLTGEKYTRLTFIAIKADPQIADKINSKNILFNGLNFSRN